MLKSTFISLFSAMLHNCNTDLLTIFLVLFKMFLGGVILKNNVAIIIPSYNPSIQLIQVINELLANNYSNIIVINDGSINDSIFNKLPKSVVVLQHSKNKGKGAALKSGFSYCLNNLHDIDGVITVDDDGQHFINDINKIYDNITENNILLGVRNFHKKDVPFKSKFGNFIISKFIYLAYHYKIQDSQTGLRFIPTYYLHDLLSVRRNTI